MRGQGHQGGRKRQEAEKLHTVPTPVPTTGGGAEGEGGVEDERGVLGKHTESETGGEEDDRIKKKKKVDEY